MCAFRMLSAMKLAKALNVQMTDVCIVALLCQGMLSNRERQRLVLLRVGKTI